jgi:hypothetical protein
MAGLKVHYISTELIVISRFVNFPLVDWCNFLNYLKLLSVMFEFCSVSYLISKFRESSSFKESSSSKSNTSSSLLSCWSAKRTSGSNYLSRFLHRCWSSGSNLFLLGGLCEFVLFLLCVIDTEGASATGIFFLYPCVMLTCLAKFIGLFSFSRLPIIRLEN